MGLTAVRRASLNRRVHSILAQFRFMKHPEIFGYGQTDRAEENNPDGHPHPPPFAPLGVFLLFFSGGAAGGGLW